MLVGHYHYYAVPTNFERAGAVPARRKSNLAPIAAATKPARALEPRADASLRASLPTSASPHPSSLAYRHASLSVDPRWEPGAGNPLAGFCPGGGPKGPSLPEPRFAPRSPPASNLLLASRGNIFGFGPPKTKMRSRLPCRPSRLPAFLISRKGFGTSGQLDGSPRRSFIVAFGRHGSFCKRSAAGQPRDV